MFAWLAHVAGLDNAGGGWYLWWSGIGSDLGEFAIFALVWRRLNCHVKGCWRLALHKVPGTPYATCRRHHPNLPDAAPTASQVQRRATGGLNR